MLKSEAIWLKNNIEQFLSNNSGPVLNLGSSTLDFRTKTQPYIEELVVKPIEQITNSTVIHSDIKSDSGVDLPGDIFHLDFQKKIIDLNFNTIICTSLLEQVEDPKGALKIITSFLKKDGLLFITVPKLFPYHNDPIDNMYRPSPEELFNQIDPKQFTLLKKEVIIDSESFIKFLIKKPRLLAITLIRIVTPFYKYRAWRHQISYLPYFFSKFKTSCIIVKRIS